MDRNPVFTMTTDQALAELRPLHSGPMCASKCNFGDFVNYSVWLPKHGSYTSRESLEAAVAQAKMALTGPKLEPNEE
jgi:hypothetical protein